MPWECDSSSVFPVGIPWMGMNMWYYRNGKYYKGMGRNGNQIPMKPILHNSTLCRVANLQNLKLYVKLSYPGHHTVCLNGVLCTVQSVHFLHVVYMIIVLI